MNLLKMIQLKRTKPFGLALMCFFGLSKSIIAQKAQLIIPNLNHFYYGVDNQCFIRASDNEKYFLKALDTQSMKIKKVNQNEYLISVTRFTNLDRFGVVIGVQQSKKIRWMDTTFFKAQTLPNPQLFLKGVELINKNFNLYKMPKELKLLVSTKNEYLDNYFKYRVIKFRCYLISKKNGMFEFNSNSDSLPKKDLEIIKSKIQSDDILLFESVYIKNQYNQVSLIPSLLVYYQKSEKIYYHYQFNCENLIQGYIRKDGKLYNYNNKRFNPNDSANRGVIMDSVWKYSNFNDETKQFECYQLDSFSKNKLVKSYFYNKFRVSEVLYINDSMAEFKQFYNDGKLCQKGKVLINSNYSKYSYYDFLYEEQEENWKCLVGVEYKNSIYINYLNDLENDFFPIGEWLFFDENGVLLIKMSFDKVKIKEQYLNIQNAYQIIPKGACYIYNPDGTVKQIETY